MISEDEFEAYHRHINTDNNTNYEFETVPTIIPVPSKNYYCSQQYYCDTVVLGTISIIGIAIVAGVACYVMTPAIAGAIVELAKQAVYVPIAAACTV